MKLEVDENGNLLHGKVEGKWGTYWYNMGILHRIFNPAVIEKDQNGKIIRKKWFFNGMLHRDDGPAIEHVKSDKEECWLGCWFRYGKRHREDGPAVVGKDYEEWYFDGALHREDGPAIIRKNGNKEWYQKGKLHRENGPAIELANGSRAWYKDGVCTKTEFDNIIEIPRKKETFEEVNEDLSFYFSKFEGELGELICKYESSPNTYIFSEFLKVNLEMFKRFIVERDTFINMEKPPYLMVDNSSLVFKKAKIKG